MRLLLDINIFLDVVFERQGYQGSAALIATCGRQNEAWIAWHSLATLFYLIDRKTSPEEARSFVGQLLGWARVAATTHDDALRAHELPIRDFEDALQSAAAMACDAAFIITRNGPDFVRSPIPAVGPEDFISRSAETRAERGSAESR